jgi:hypothetical protein
MSQISRDKRKSIYINTLTTTLHNNCQSGGEGYAMAYLI